MATERFQRDMPLWYSSFFPEDVKNRQLSLKCCCGQIDMTGNRSDFTCRLFYSAAGLLNYRQSNPNVWIDVEMWHEELVRKFLPFFFSQSLLQVFTCCLAPPLKSLFPRDKKGP